MGRLPKDIPDVLPLDGSIPTNGNGHHEDPEPLVTEEEPDWEDENMPTGRREVVPPMLSPVAPSGAGWQDDYIPLKELFSDGDKPDDIDLRTELSEGQIIQFARARAIAEYHNIPMLRQFVSNIARLSVSKGRKGRKEFVDAFRSGALGDGAEAMAMAGGIMGKFKS